MGVSISAVLGTETVFFNVGVVRETATVTTAVVAVTIFVLAPTACLTQVRVCAVGVHLRESVHDVQ